jgi:hypothetical protein
VVNGYTLGDGVVAASSFQDYFGIIYEDDRQANAIGFFDDLTP